MSDGTPTSPSTNDVRHVAWAELPTEAILPGVTRQVIHGTRESVVRYVYAPGAVFPRHSHSEEQVTLVVRGRIAFDVGDGRHELRPGEVLVIPGGVPHGAAVIGDAEVETFNALSPRRTINPEIGAG